MRYTQYEFFTKDEIERDWLVSILSDFYFEGFEETGESLKAFVPADKVQGVDIAQVLADNEFEHIEFEATLIEPKNWNEEWEKNFEPVTIAGNVAIRAPFHAPMAAAYELIIEPKMSFGTGHHATTALMVELMLPLDFNGKAVLDFGSGTGVLAILASKLKAAKVLTIDNETWAYENCMENVERNKCVNIVCALGDETYHFNGERFDFILANINRHVILKNIARWALLLQPGAQMLVSGILQADEKDIVAAAAQNGLTAEKIKHLNGWIAIVFTN